MHLFIRIAVYLAAGYLILCLMFYFGQNRLLYFPDRRKPEELDIQTRGLEFWPDSDESFRGYLCPPEFSICKGLIIVFHGNAGAAWNRDYYCQKLGALGYQILLAEYPGYGGRPGKFSEEHLVRDARETIRMVKEQYSGPVYLTGESLGAGVVAAAVSDTSLNVDGLCLITPWADLADLAQSIYPFAPVRWLIRNRYDNVRNLSECSARIAVAVAEHDEVVSAEQGLKLFASIRTDKKLWIVNDTSHNTWMFRVPPSFWQEIMDFLNPSEEEPAP